MMIRLPLLLKKLRTCTLPNKSVFWLCFFSILLIPFRIFTYNYWPIDDANRHVAKVISGKSWPEILVMDPQFQSLDHNGGWHFLLNLLYRLGADAETMVLCSCIGLFLLLTLSGLFLFHKNPLVWMGALALAPYVADTNRWIFGRPFMVSAFTLLTMLYAWDKQTGSLRLRWILSSLLFALTGWIHGAWYLMALLPFAFFLAGKMKTALQLASAWALGSLGAGLLSGQPLHFLVMQFIQTVSSVDSAAVTRLLVGEFQPQMEMLPILFGVILFMFSERAGIPVSCWKSSPGLWLALTGWILSMVNGRFWWDWGSVGYLYLVAVSLLPLLEGSSMTPFSRNLFHVSLACLCVFLLYATDVGSRWSNNHFRDRLSLEDPAHKDWLPEPGGILYSDSMKMYYETFFNNPHGDWRYMLGHEPALMPAEDLSIYREIQFYKHTVDALFLPWVEKMNPEDRLILYRNKAARPDIPQLEWKYIAYNTWSGRLPGTGGETGAASVSEKGL